MGVLIDTSILGRLANRADVSHSLAVGAVAELHRRGETLYVAPQNCVEFRNFATRPVIANGLGLAPFEADRLLGVFEAAFTLLEETRDIYPAWKNIVQALGIVGKQVHDARIIVMCHVHAVTQLLTFNVAHFARMAGLRPGVVVLDARTL